MLTKDAAVYVEYATKARAVVEQKRAAYAPVTDPRYSWCNCQNCHSFNDDYMVHDEVWVQATFLYERKGFLCLACLGTRLGRPLRVTDFPPVITNAGILTGFLLGAKNADN